MGGFGFRYFSIHRCRPFGGTARARCDCDCRLGARAPRRGSSCSCFVSPFFFFLSSTAAARALHLQRPPRDVPTAALPSKTTRSPQLQISRTTSGGLKIEIELNRQVLRISCEFSGDEMDLFGRNDQQTDHITWAGAARRDNSTPSIRRSHPA